MAVVAVGEVIYVADPGVKGVHRFDQAAGRYDLLRGEGDMPLGSPVSLARGANGNVYGADSALGKVFVIRPGAKSVSPLALHAELRQPTGIAADPATGRLFVVDTAAHRVLAFRPDGSVESSFGGRGAGDGEFNYPTLAWRDDSGRLYVTDALNFRIQFFDAQGKFLGKFGRVGDGTGDAARQKGVATDRFGHVYIVDSLFHAFQVFDPSGRFLLSVGEPGSGRGEFWLPTGIFISENDTIYVADSYNRRVQVFRYIGGPT
jgi:DNA-binding beta-propeller fold protein YncE